MVVLAYAVPGTLVFTKSCVSFTADDSSEEYNNANQLVRNYDSITISSGNQWFVSKGSLIRESLVIALGHMIIITH